MAIASELFQSRNRDACHFRFMMHGSGWAGLSFQSRNRDACHFRLEKCLQYTAGFRFNLAIEMLVISGMTAKLLSRP